MDICFTSDESYSNEAMHGEGKLIHARLFSLRSGSLDSVIFLVITRPATRRYAMECWKMPLNEGNPDITKRPGIPLFSLLS